MFGITFSQKLLDRCDEITKNIIEERKRELTLSRELIDEIEIIFNRISEKKYKGLTLSQVISSITAALKSIGADLDDLLEEEISPHIEECREKMQEINMHLNHLQKLRKICDGNYLLGLKEQFQKGDGFRSLPELQSFLSLIENLRSAHITSKVEEANLKELLALLKSVENDFKSGKNKEAKKTVSKAVKTMEDVVAMFETAKEELDELEP